jgi:hypothetical protein
MWEPLPGGRQPEYASMSRPLPRSRGSRDRAMPISEDLHFGLPHQDLGVLHWTDATERIAIPSSNDKRPHSAIADTPSGIFDPRGYSETTAARPRRTNRSREMKHSLRGYARQCRVDPAQPDGGVARTPGVLVGGAGSGWEAHSSVGSSRLQLCEPRGGGATDLSLPMRQPPVHRSFM